MKKKLLITSLFMLTALFWSCTEDVTEPEQNQGHENVMNFSLKFPFKNVVVYTKSIAADTEEKVVNTVDVFAFIPGGKLEVKKTYLATNFKPDSPTITFPLPSGANGMRNFYFVANKNAGAATVLDRIVEGVTEENDFKELLTLISAEDPMKGKTTDGFLMTTQLQAPIVVNSVTKVTFKRVVARLDIFNKTKNGFSMTGYFLKNTRSQSYIWGDQPDYNHVPLVTWRLNTAALAAPVSPLFKPTEMKKASYFYEGLPTDKAAVVVHGVSEGIDRVFEIPFPKEKGVQRNHLYRLNIISGETQEVGFDWDTEEWNEDDMIGSADPDKPIVSLDPAYNVLGLYNELDGVTIVGGISLEIPIIAEANGPITLDNDAPSWVRPVLESSSPFTKTSGIQSVFKIMVDPNTSDQERVAILTFKHQSDPENANTVYRIVQKPQAEMVSINLASGVIFKMGSSDGSNIGNLDGTGLNTTPAEVGREVNNNEKQHYVKLTTDYKLGKYPVTTTEFALFLNENKIDAKGVWANANTFKDKPLLITNSERTDPYLIWIDTKDKKGWFPVAGREKHAVGYITWYGAMEYANWVGGTLPTEAEWEYACRAGNESAYWFDGIYSVDDAIWYSENTNRLPVDVGMKKPNGFGLYDMAGTINEWILDAYATNYDTNALSATSPENASVNPVVEGTDVSHRVYKGGAWVSALTTCRSAFRKDTSPANSLAFNLGFRVCYK